MHILYIVPYTPTPIRTRPYNLLVNLAKQGHSVTLATVWENDEEHQFLDNFSKKGIEVLTEQLSRAQITKNLLYAVIKRLPLQATYSWCPNLANKIAVKINGGQLRSDIIQIEHLRGAIYGWRLKQMIHPSKAISFVWDSVDNITYLFEQATQHSRSGFGRWVTRLELPLTRRYERQLLEHFQHILVSSKVDKEAFINLKGADTLQTTALLIQVLPNGVDLEYFQPAALPRTSETVLFSGKLSYHANISAARFLVEGVMPLVWSRRPGVKVQLVGKDPHPSLVELGQRDPRVQVTGTVPDIRKYLCRATVSAATLTYGAGIQNKVLEAMACATPVVATSKAATALQALPGQDLLVADEAAQLADHLLHILDNPELARQIGDHGRQYVVANHDWQLIVHNLTNCYENIDNATENHPVIR